MKTLMMYVFDEVTKENVYMWWWRNHVSKFTTEMCCWMKGVVYEVTSVNAHRKCAVEWRMEISNVLSNEEWKFWKFLVHVVDCKRTRCLCVLLDRSLWWACFSCMISFHMSIVFQCPETSYIRERWTTHRSEWWLSHLWWKMSALCRHCLPKPLIPRRFIISGWKLGYG